MRVTFAKSVSEENFQKQKKKTRGLGLNLSTYVEGSEQVLCYLALFFLLLGPRGSRNGLGGQVVAVLDISDDISENDSMIEIVRRIRTRERSPPW